MAVRNSCKVLMEKGGKYLLNHYLHEDGLEYYDLPGGGQRPYESLEEAAIRECREETGYEVEIVRLGAIREEIYDDPEVRKAYPDFSHKLHFIFLVRQVDIIRWEATKPDRHQIGCRWMTLEEMEEAAVRVDHLADLIRDMNASGEILYREPIHKNAP